MSETNAPTKTISDFEAKLNEADKNVASFETDDSSLIARARMFLGANPTAIPGIILVLSIFIFSLIAHNFLLPGTLSTILKQVSVVGIIAIAQTIVILTAGIDLSVGMMLVIATMVMGRFATLDAYLFPVWLVVPMGIAIGGLMGAFNGLLVTRARIPPFIATLGTYFIFRALNQWYTGSESVRPTDLDTKAPGLLIFGHPPTIFGYPLEFGGFSAIGGTYAMLAIAAIVWYMLNRTAWGRHVHAVGDDPDAAMLSGIQINSTLVSVYALAGLICGIGAWIAIGRVGSISPISFENINLDSITAVVIGGTSLFGGRASIVGSVLGAMIVGVFNMGLSLSGVDSYWQMFASGCLIIAAVAIDQWLRRASQ
jgi:fructose transport system permease protein